MVANSHPGRPEGKCHRKDTADGLYLLGNLGVSLSLIGTGTGNGEMVRQERTAVSVTVLAG